MKNFLILFLLLIPLQIVKIENNDSVLREEVYSQNYIQNEEGDIEYTNSDANHRYYATLHSDGSLDMWGENTYGQLGNNSTNDIGNGSNAEIIYNLNDGWVYIGEEENNNYSGIKDMSLAKSHTIALMNDGSVYGFGNNAEGGLGRGDDLGSQLTPLLIYDAPGDGDWEEEISNSGFSYSINGEEESAYSPKSGYHGKVTSILTPISQTTLVFEDGAIFTTQLNYDSNFFFQPNQTFSLDARSFAIENMIVNEDSNTVEEMDFSITGLFSIYDSSNENFNVKINMISNRDNISRTYNLEFTGYENGNYSKKYFSLNLLNNNNPQILSDTDYEISSIEFYSGEEFIDKVFIASNDDEFLADEGFHFKTDYSLAKIDDVSVSKTYQNGVSIDVKFEDINDTDINSLKFYTNDSSGNQLLLNFSDVDKIKDNTYRFDFYGLKSNSDFNGIDIYAPTNDYYTEITEIYEDESFTFTTKSSVSPEPFIYTGIAIGVIFLIIFILFISYYLYYRKKIRQYKKFKKAINDLNVKNIDNDFY